MVRRAAVSAVVLGVLISAVEAGQTSGSFQVGVTIGGPQMKKAAVPAATKRYTWGAAAISVTRAGFDGVERIEQSGALYWFAARRDGGSYRIAVSIATGKIMKVVPT